MAATPVWFSQLRWSDVWPVVGMTMPSIQLPSRSGCYVFTDYAGPLIAGRSLYVGKAADLRERVGGYLVDYKSKKPTKHKGRMFIFEYRENQHNSGLYLRWTEYGDPRALEGGLIHFLWPAMNDRVEACWLDDDESLDPRYL